MFFSVYNAVQQGEHMQMQSLLARVHYTKNRESIQLPIPSLRQVMMQY